MLNYFNATLVIFYDYIRERSVQLEISELFQMQKSLDQYIQNEHGLDGEDLFVKKVLALVVEVGELANETRCFKFWSSKPAAEKEVILEEFVDGIHFILSLGLEIGISTEHFSLGEVDYLETDLSSQFLNVYGAISDFKENRSIANYQNLFQQFLYVANLLGFSHEEIISAYKQKNEVNYNRQKEGY